MPLGWCSSTTSASNSRTPEGMSAWRRASRSTSPLRARRSLRPRRELGSKLWFSFGRGGPAPLPRSLAFAGTALSVSVSAWPHRARRLGTPLTWMDCTQTRTQPSRGPSRSLSFTSMAPARTEPLNTVPSPSTWKTSSRRTSRPASARSKPLYARVCGHWARKARRKPRPAPVTLLTWKQGTAPGPARVSAASSAAAAAASARSLRSARHAPATSS
mmetsp:Transcript_31150/g.98890  ORF Transcript_31150/g.98890 Transcript_31150/m.98890 type:complete len:216 (+) Transcript_31150:1135-1782(+)